MAAEYRIATLSPGGVLTFVERLSIASFQATGLHVDLYAHEDVADPPDGVAVRDASAIVARSVGPTGLLKDLFRYRLLAAEDRTIWVGLDCCLLAPLSPKDGRLFGAESEAFIGPDILSLPPDSAALGAMLAFTANEHPIPPWLSAPERAALAASGEPLRAADHPWGVWGRARSRIS